LKTDGVLDSDVIPDYAAWLPLANDAMGLATQASLVFCAGQMSTASFETVRGALEAMPATNDSQRRNRVMAAILLTMAAPDYLVVR
jgi:hypothetical protein